MKRRKRRARHAGRRDAFHLTMIAVLMTVLCLMIVNIKFVEQWRVCLFIQQYNHAENERD